MVTYCLSVEAICYLVALIANIKCFIPGSSKLDRAKCAAIVSGNGAILHQFKIYILKYL